MKKTFNLNDLDCANCAMKMEEGIKKIDGVIDANVNFITQTLMLEADDDVFEDIFKKVIKVCKKIEPDCEILR